MTDRDDRRTRRAWIAAHHPDRGGDPVAFAAGLRRWAGGTEHRGTEHRGTEHRGTEHRGTEHRGTEHAAGSRTRTRVVVIRSRNPLRILRRLGRRVVVARRRRTHRGRPG